MLITFIDGLECGGAYMKLLRDNKALHQEEFSNASPYVIMFGPDKCGATNKVHLIINHKNPKTGEYEEKHLNGAPAARIVKTTELVSTVRFFEALMIYILDYAG
jgi:calnexin